MSTEAKPVKVKVKKAEKPETIKDAVRRLRPTDRLVVLRDFIRKWDLNVSSQTGGATRRNKATIYNEIVAEVGLIDVLHSGNAPKRTGDGTKNLKAGDITVYQTALRKVDATDPKAVLRLINCFALAGVLKEDTLSLIIRDLSSFVDQGSVESKSG